MSISRHGNASLGRICSQARFETRNTQNPIAEIKKQWKSNCWDPETQGFPLWPIFCLSNLRVSVDLKVLDLEHPPRVRSRQALRASRGAREHVFIFQHEHVFILDSVLERLLGTVFISEHRFQRPTSNKCSWTREQRSRPTLVNFPLPLKVNSMVISGPILCDNLCW